MPILQRQLLKEMFVNAIITFGVVTMIFVIGGALKILHDTEYLTLDLFAKLVIFFIGTKLGTILPMTVLMATMFTYGRVSAENEIDAMRASGIHLSHAFAPGILFGLLTSALVLHVNDDVAPRMEFAWTEVRASNVVAALEAIASRGDRGIEISDNELLFWDSRDPETGHFLKLRIKRYATGKTTSKTRALEDEIFAESGYVTFDDRTRLVYLHLRNVRTLQGKSVDTSAEVADIPVPLASKAREKRLNHYSLTELLEGESRRYDDAPKKRSLEAEFHQRIAGGFTCFLFVLVGMPLAVIFKQGNRMIAFLIALLVALVVYYPTFILGKVLAKETDLLPAVAIWSGSGVLLLLGLGLIAVVLRR